jgi:hypothetical protein
VLKTRSCWERHSEELAPRKDIERSAFEGFDSSETKKGKVREWLASGKSNQNTVGEISISGNEGTKDDEE